MSNQTRHDQLIAAGWSYDAVQDRYRAPKSPGDGTATLYNQASAWQRYQADQSGSANQPDAPPSGTRQTDPRRQEPQ